MTLKAVHAVKNSLGITPEAYSSLLNELGVTSSKELDEAGHRRLIAMMYDTKRPKTKTPAEKKIWALWYELRELLPPQEQNANYFLGIVKRASKSSLKDLRYLSTLTPYESYKTIEALKKRLDEEDDQPVPF